MDVFKLNMGSYRAIESDNDGVGINLSEILLHPIYTSLWTLKARYKYIFGSKDNGKSFQSALKVVTK